MFPDEELDKHAVYMGFLSDTPQEKFNRKHDPKVGETVIWLVANIFKEFPWSIISYVCSPADEQARNRSVAFSKWFNKSPLIEKINYHRKKVGDTYCGVMFNKKHPDIDNIELAFSDFDPENKFGPRVEEPITMYETLHPQEFLDDEEE